MKLYLICPLAAVALIINAEAAPKDKNKDKPTVLEILKEKDKGKYTGPVASVPDSGSTAVLLGTSLFVLGVARRRLATR